MAASQTTAASIAPSPGGFKERGRRRSGYPRTGLAIRSASHAKVGRTTTTPTMESDSFRSDLSEHRRLARDQERSRECGRSAVAEDRPARLRVGGEHGRDRERLEEDGEGDEANAGTAEDEGHVRTVGRYPPLLDYRMGLPVVRVRRLRLLAWLGRVDSRIGAPGAAGRGLRRVQARSVLSRPTTVRPAGRLGSARPMQAVSFNPPWRS